MRNSIIFQHAICFCLICFAISAACGASAAQEPSAADADRFADLGGTEDGNKSADIYLAPDWSFWGGGKNWDRFIRYENDEEFRWATTPRKKEKYISSRVQKSVYAGQIRIRAFAKKPAKVYLAIRYKDNLVSPAATYINKNGQLVSLGSFGGKLDRAWKTALFTVGADKLAATDGYYRFQIGRSDYNGIEGDLPLDWVKLSTKPITPEPDKPGFYPKRVPSRFDNLAKTQIYSEGGKPLFPMGMCMLGLRTVTFDQLKKAHLNSLMLLGWELSFDSKRRVYSGDRYSDRLSAGVPDLIDMAERSGINLMPCPGTDTRSYWIQKQYGSEGKALTALERGFAKNSGAKSLLAWFIKDETDHDDDTWGSPEEFIQQVYNAQKRADPSKPTLVNFQGWKTGQYPRYMDAADIVAFDSYPIGRGDSGRAIAVYADRMRKEVKGKKALWAIVEAYDREHVAKIGRQMTKKETLVQAYIAIAHGMQGVFFFVGNSNPYIDLAEMTGPWGGITQAGSEFLGPQGIEYYLKAPAKPMHIADTDGKNLASEKEIHVGIFEGPDKSQMMVAANDCSDAIDDVTIKWPGLAAGRTIEVRFESRTITSLDGAVKDNFSDFGRHVYIVK